MFLFYTQKLCSYLECKSPHFWINPDVSLASRYINPNVNVVTNPNAFSVNSVLLLKLRLLLLVNSPGFLEFNREETPVFVGLYNMYIHT